ncbi:MAG: diguanylate cyclase [Gemmatimonadales bacterium]
MTESLDSALVRLSRNYVGEAPTRIAELRKDLAAFEAGEVDALDSLKVRFHRLAGSGGSYGFPAISTAGRRAEQWIIEHPGGGPETYPALHTAVDEIAAALDQAADGLASTGEADATPAPRIDFAWHALILGASPERAAILAAPLESAGFTVRIGRGEAEGPDDIPAHAHPDLVVVVHEPEGPDPYPTATAWSSRRQRRPRAVVLVDLTLERDRLRAAIAGVDTVFHGATVEAELPGFARALARVGQPPGSVLLVEDDPDSARMITSVLEQANLRITRCAGVREAEQSIDGMYPDLFLLDVGLPDGDGFTLARYIRHDARFALTPVVFLTAASGPESQLEALRAGGDDFLAKPAHPQILTQLVVSRIERGRRIRELAHRDGLTGLLNHATLMAELEHAAETGHRRKEPFAFVMVDLDHFKRINDRHGHLAGDQVLVHISRLLQRVGRASDLLGRYGGDEFGLILPGNGVEGAMILAERTRAAMAEDPPRTPSGSSIAVRLSMGIAIFPEDGERASTLVQAADRALYQAKRRGRNQVIRAQDVG